MLSKPTNLDFWMTLGGTIIAAAVSYLEDDLLWRIIWFVLAGANLCIAIGIWEKLKRERGPWKQ